MDPENQDRIKALVERIGADDLVVVLGAADPEALEVAAETVTAGDPSYVGPLAGVSLGLPVVHIFEDEVKEQVDPSVYEEQVGLLELALDTDAVKEAMREGARLNAAFGRSWAGRGRPSRPLSRLGSVGEDRAGPWRARRSRVAAGRAGRSAAWARSAKTVPSPRGLGDASRRCAKTVPSPCGLGDRGSRPAEPAAQPPILTQGRPFQ